MCGYHDFQLPEKRGAPGDLVAVLGLGGLGHLAVQFSAKMGFKTIAIARGKDKAPLAAELGAHAYIDTQADDPSAELREMGGAKVILATVTNADAMKAVIGGLSANGTMMIVGAVTSLEVPSMQLLLNRQSVKGWYSGTSIDSQDTLAFSVLSGVRSMNEVFPFERNRHDCRVGHDLHLSILYQTLQLQTTLRQCRQRLAAVAIHIDHGQIPATRQILANFFPPRLRAVAAIGIDKHFASATTGATNSRPSGWPISIHNSICPVRSLRHRSGSSGN